VLVVAVRAVDAASIIVIFEARRTPCATSPMRDRDGRAGAGEHSVVVGRQGRAFRRRRWPARGLRRSAHAADGHPPKTKDRPAQVMLFSAASESAGSTTTAANYAFALAQSGRRVAIVDANLREPAQHRMFGIDSTPGLAEALASRDMNLDFVMCTTSIDGISLVPAGLCPPNPSELLESSA
jgi:Mrp family chromosome partitioning ATPase